MKIIVGVLELKFFLRSSTSLKDKRRIIKSFKDRIRSKHNVSIAEVDYQDNIKIAQLAVATVGSDSEYLQGVLREIRNKALGTYGAELAADDYKIVRLDELADDAYDWDDDEFY